MPSFAEYQATRHFPALDGLRAVSVLLVITAHLHSDAWRPLIGRQGVTLFFVLSGFIITTLLEREEARTGRVSLRSFAVRRVFRIVPLYAIVLGVYVVAVLGLGMEGDKAAGLRYALPYFLTFTNEIALFGEAFRNHIPFYQSWSLGVEEKFYVLWPLLGFVLLDRRARLPGIVILVATVCAVQALVTPAWTRWYEPILVGCLLGVLMERPGAHARLRALARPAAIWASLAALAGTHVLLNHHTTIGDLIYPWIAAALMVGLVLGSSPAGRLLSSRPAVWAGHRAYGVYLVHILAINVVDRLVRPGATLTLATLADYAGVALLSLAVADVLHRVVERPFIRAGRRVAERFGGKGAAGRPVPVRA